MPVNQQEKKMALNFKVTIFSGLLNSFVYLLRLTGIQEQQKFQQKKKAFTCYVKNKEKI